MVGICWLLMGGLGLFVLRRYSIDVVDGDLVPLGVCFLRGLLILRLVLGSLRRYLGSVVSIYHRVFFHYVVELY